MASVLGRAAPVPGADPGSIVRRPAVLAVVAVLCGILVAHAETAASIVGIWIRSETFAHGFIVIPVVCWLVWRMRGELEVTPARPFLPGVALVFVGGAAWLAATLSDVQAGRQFALLLMLEAAILAVVGVTVVRKIAFPLVFLGFAIPFGEFLIPTMIDWTADFTIAALRASGIPVYREANHFVIPSGSWSVVEACSGVRYLIASTMVGTLYAMLSYRSAKLRIVFIAASILVPIVANWLRAYGIVMLGHLSNNRIAVGVDHLIYGWLFFGIVMVALFSFGAMLREPAAQTAPPVPVDTIPGAAAPGRFVVAAVLAIVAAAVWRPLPAWIERGQPDRPVTLAPIEGAGGWVSSPASFTEWKPQMVGQAAEQQQNFIAGGQPASVFIAYYRNQREGRELVMSKNALVTKGNRSWRILDTRVAPIQWNGRTVDARRVVIGQRDGGEIAAYQLYWVGGVVTASDWVAKVLATWAKLKGAGDDSALIVVAAPGAQWSSLERFAAEVSPRIEQALAAAQRGSP